jgi:hypothetical protein
VPLCLQAQRRRLADLSNKAATRQANLEEAIRRYRVTAMRGSSGGSMALRGLDRLSEQFNGVKAGLTAVLKEAAGMCVGWCLCVSYESQAGRS